MSEQATYYGASEDDDLSYSPQWWLVVIAALAGGVAMLPVVWLAVWVGVSVGLWWTGVR